MKKRKLLSSVIGSIALSAGSIWIGSYIARLLTIYQMFEPNEIILKNSLNSNNLPVVFQTIFPLVNLTFFSYIVMIISFTLFIVSTDLKLKQNGWLFIIAMIIYFTFPFEFLLLTIDYRLINYFVNEQFTSGEIFKLFVERITSLSSFPVILVFSYLTIPFFIVFKPFTLNPKDEN
jgi:hypothetical protein